METISNSGSFWTWNCHHANLGFHSIPSSTPDLDCYICGWVGRFLVRIGAGKSGKSAQDWALRRAAKQQKNTEIVWSEGYLASNMAGSKNILSPSTLDAKTQAAE